MPKGKGVNPIPQGDINTLIIQEVLSEPHWKNKLTEEDYRALTPLFSTHINPYGLFPIDLGQRISIKANLLKGQVA